MSAERAVDRIRNLRPIVEDGAEWLDRADILEILEEER